MSATIRIKNQISDTMVMCGRVLRHNLRSMDTIITVLAMPIMMMMMSVYVFGGAMDTGSTNYIDYIIPGIVLFCITSGVAYTAVRLNDDVTKGIFERFHSMPIAKSSILGGHVVTSVVFNAISVTAVLLIAFLMGFRPHAGFTGWLFVTGILFLFTLAMTWIAVTFGLIAKSIEGAGVFSYLLIGLIFTSSAFAPTETMPAVLRYFAKYQPITPIIESVRFLLVDGKIDNSVWAAIVWCVGIWIVFHIVAMRIYKGRVR